MKLGEGFADGGAAGDTYHVDTVRPSTIKDTGVGGGTDIVFLDRIHSLSDLSQVRIGNDLVLQSETDIETGFPYDNAKVVLEDWYSGYDSIEFFVFADGTQVSGSVIG